MLSAVKYLNFAVTIFQNTSALKFIKT